ncbi:uncharacterized protein [Temnothorax longispinosus]|uniref:uncharacterized protein n=1 Tax=Temnothorax longispinosus TaxID=300112 RepID=UPI003A99D91A
MTGISHIRTDMSDHEAVQPATAVASSETKDKAKRKGPKPSSKRRLEKFRLSKSKETMAEIHKQATECQARHRIKIEAQCDVQNLRRSFRLNKTKDNQRIKPK